MFFFVLRHSIDSFIVSAVSLRIGVFENQTVTSQTTKLNVMKKSSDTLTTSRTNFAQLFASTFVTSIVFTICYTYSMLRVTATVAIQTTEYNSVVFLSEHFFTDRLSFPNTKKMNSKKELSIVYFVSHKTK